MSVDERTMRWEALTVGGGLLLVLLLFFYPATLGKAALFPGDLIFDRDPLWQPLAPPGFAEPGNALLADQVAQFYPWRFWARQALAQGKLPLWNPYTGGGQPFVGNAQSALFDPLTWAAWLLPLWAGFVVTALLRLWVAGFFTYLLARAIGWQRGGALLASLTFMLSGPLIVWVGYPLASVICWLPALLWGTERALTLSPRKRRPETISESAAFQEQHPLSDPFANKIGVPARLSVYHLLISLFIAFQFFGGHPETSFLVLLTWGAYAFVRTSSLYDRKREMGQQLVPLGAMAILGTALAAVQLLPFLEALGHSITLIERQTAGSTILSALAGEWRAWPILLMALLPNFFGTPLDNSYWYPTVNFNEATLYVGVLPLVLAAVATLYAWRVADARRRTILFFAVIGLLALGIAVRLPLLNGVELLPLFNISNNGRWRLIYAFCLALAAGAGGDLLLREVRARRWAGQLLLLLATAGLLVSAVAYGGFWLYSDELIRSGRSYYAALVGTPYLVHPPAHYEALAVTRHLRKLVLYRPDHVVMYLPLLVAAFYLVWQQWLFPMRWRRMAVALLPALVLGDAFLVWYGYNPTMQPRHLYPEPGAIRFLRQEPGLFRINATGAILNPNTSILFGLADVRGYDPLLPRRYVELVEQIDGFFPIGHHLHFTHGDDPLLELLNVKYLLTDQMPGERWQLVYEDGGAVRVFANPDVLPRAFLVHAVEVVNDSAAALDRVTDDAFDFRRVALLEDEPPAGWRPGPADAGATVELVAYGAQRVHVRVESGSDSLLVLSDAYMPGWRATVDGTAAPVLVANYALRAVALPAGPHDVVLSYRPRAFAAGLWVTVVALLGVIYLWARLSPRGYARP